MNTNITSGNNAASPTPGEPLVGFRELTQHLRMCKRTIQYHMRRGLPYYPIGACIRFRISEVDAWVSSRLRIDTSLAKTDPNGAINVSGPKPTIKIQRSNS